MDATQAASLLQAADNAPGLPGGLPGVGNLGSKLLNSNQIDASSASKEENSSSYMIMSPQGKHIFYPAKAHCFHMEVKVAVLNTISQNYNFFEVKLIPYASLCLGNYLDQIFVKFWVDWRPF